MRLIIAVFFLSLVGCGSIQYTQTGEAFQSRSVECNFKIYSTVPQVKYTEIGVIDLTPGGYGSGVYRELPEFKKAIQPQVCKAGGDAVIAMANGYGMYMKATVIKLEK